MRRILLVCLTTLASLGAFAPPAPAAAPYSSPYFNPDVLVTVSDAQAGAHPDVAIRMSRPPNHCQPPILYEGLPPGGAPNPVQLCDISYIEQNLREWAMHLPQGLMADVNATPVTCKEPTRKGLENEYWCPPESKVGELVVRDRECFVDLVAVRQRLLDACALQDDVDGAGQEPPAWGEVFMGEPGPGEQARLYVLAGIASCIREGSERHCDYSRLVRIDTSVELSTTGEWRIASTSVDIPDTVQYNAASAPLQVSMYEATITLFGDTGTDRGHPLLTNPASCQARTLDSTFTGYGTNSYFTLEGIGIPGEGWGSTVEDSVRYPVVGCNALPYAPDLSVDLGTPIPRSPTGLTAVLTQERGEQTTDRVEVEVPRSFRVNFDNRLEQCTADQAAARACPPGSEVGEIEAESALLPETGDFAGPLRGKVFVGETTSDHIRLYTILRGFVEATIEGRLEMMADGTSRTVFDLPEVPQQRIVLTLYGGEDTALITAPKSCGTHVLEATFTSHQGTQAKREIPVEVSCGGASFDVEVGTRRPRAHPTILLAASSPDMRSVGFDLSRYLKVGRDLRRAGARSRLGTLSVTGDEGTRELKVKLARQGSLGSLALSATEGGAQVTTLGAYDASLSAKAKRRLTTKRGKRRAKGPTRLWVRDLPPGTTNVSLELTGSRGSLIQNPERCRIRGKRLHLGFAAHLGQRHGRNATLQRSVTLGCKKARRTRRR